MRTKQGEGTKMAEGWEVRLAGVLNEARVPHPCGAAVDYIVRAANYAPEAAREFLELAKGKIEVAIQLCGGGSDAAPGAVKAGKKAKAGASAGSATGKEKARAGKGAKPNKTARPQAAFKRCSKCGEAKGHQAFSNGSSVCRLCLKKAGGGLNPDKPVLSTYEDEPELDDMLGSDPEDEADDDEDDDGG